VHQQRAGSDGVYLQHAHRGAYVVREPPALAQLADGEQHDVGAAEPVHRPRHHFAVALE
jgi:hypothetical protein